MFWKGQITKCSRIRTLFADIIVWFQNRTRQIQVFLCCFLSLKRSCRHWPESSGQSRSCSWPRSAICSSLSASQILPRWSFYIQPPSSAPPALRGTLHKQATDFRVYPCDLSLPNLIHPCYTVSKYVSVAIWSILAEGGKGERTSVQSALLGDSGGVVNSLDFCPASLKSLGCFYFRCVLSSQWKSVTVNLRILYCQR